MRDFVTDPDGVISNTRRYQWYADDVPILGMNTFGFTVDASLIGKAISVQVDYKDFNGVVESVRSAVTLPVIDKASPMSLRMSPQTASTAADNFGIEQLIQAMSAFAPEAGVRSDLPLAQQPRPDILLAAAH